MKQRTVSLLILLFAILVMSLHLGMKQQPDMSEVKQYSDMYKKPIKWPGKTAPDFKLTTVDGEDFSLSEHVGKEVVILNFFATWCGPCVEEMPELSRYYSEHKDDGIILLGINADEEPDEVKDFLKKNKVSFNAGVDKGSVRNKYGVASYPTTVVIGVDGKVQLYEIGPIMNADIAFGKLLDDNKEMLAAGKGVSAETYRKDTERENYRDVTVKDNNKDVELTGRAKEISQKMNCVCGCDDVVDKCNCKTAGDIKAELGKMDFGDKTDSEIIKELNAKYCK